MSKKKNILFVPVLMSFLMSIIRIGFSLQWEIKDIFPVFIQSWPIMLIASILMSQIIVLPLVRVISKYFLTKIFRKIELFIITFCMSSTMTLFRLMISMQYPITLNGYLLNWGINFCLALLLQIVIVRPLLKLIE
ncbi:hypothetical protein HO504_02015 [Streptococcus suis]|nr:hypothetical protein [Streptococcus suis]